MIDVSRNNWVLFLKRWNEKGFGRMTLAQAIVDFFGRAFNEILFYQSEGNSKVFRRFFEMANIQ